jgi:hypothetical protein
MGGSWSLFGYVGQGAVRAPSARHGPARTAGLRRGTAARRPSRAAFRPARRGDFPYLRLPSNKELGQ